MKHLAILVALCGWMVGAAPAVQSHQFTAFSGNSVVAAVPAGAAGERLYLIVAAPQFTGVTVPSGWTQVSYQRDFMTVLVLMRTSDGTEASVTVPLSASVSGQAVVVRVSGAVFPIPSVGTSNTAGSPTAPDAGGGPPLAVAPYLHLTFAAVSAGAPVLAPSGYSNILYAANGIGLMVAERSSNGGVPENAGPWLIDASAVWRAQTFSTR